MNEEYYPESTKFLPERYYDTEKMKSNPRQANIPFGLGKRNCLGKELAWNETLIYVGSTMKHFELNQPEGYNRRMVLGAGYQCKNAYVKLKLRN